MAYVERIMKIVEGENDYGYGDVEVAVADEGDTVKLSQGDDTILVDREQLRRALDNHDTDLA